MQLVRAQGGRSRAKSSISSQPGTGWTSGDEENGRRIVREKDSKGEDERRKGVR